MPPRKTPPPHLIERDLLDDARVLMSRYHTRNSAKALSAEQRKAWAEQMVILVEKLAHSLATQIGPPDYPVDAERKRIWLEQFLAGMRVPQPIDQDPPELRPAPTPSWKRAFQSERR